MNTYKVMIEGVVMDLGSDSFNIRRTLRHFDFLRVGSSIKSDRTNRLSLPLSPINIRALEAFGLLNVITVKPYRNLSIVIEQSGGSKPIVGVCQITDVVKRISIDVQGSIKNFWDSLEGLYLNDLNLSTWNGLWDNDRHDIVRNTTSGLVCPVTNNGHLVDGVTYVDGYTYGTAMIPFFYYHTIITQIFALIGYTNSGAIFSDTNRYSKMVMSTRFVYNEVWSAAKFCRTFKDTVSSANNGTGPFYDRASPFTFTSYKQGSDDFFNPSNQRYEVIDAVTALKFFRIKVRLECQIAGWVFGGTYPADPDDLSHLAIQHYRGGVFLSGYTAVVAANTNTASVEFEVDVMNGDDFTIAFNGALTGAGSTVLTNLRVTYSLVNTTDINRVQGTDWYWYFNQLLPRIELKEFMREFMRLFGLVLKEENKTVTFKTIKDILNDTTPTIVELSRENKNNIPKISYKPNGFGQINNYLWTVQGDELLITEDYGKGTFTLDNEQLPYELTQYTSIFTASDQLTEKRINQAAQITIFDQTTIDFTKAALFGSRILLLRDDDGINFRFKATTDRTDYFIGYFIDKNKTYSLDFQELLDEFYSEYSDVLNRYLVKEQQYLITDKESKEMDLFKLKVQDGVAYLIESISDYESNKFADFKLIRR